MSEIEAARQMARYSKTEFAAAVGVNQGYLSRILQGKFSKQTPIVEKCHSFARKLMEEEDASIRSDIQRSLKKAVLKAWDGTPDGANSIIRLLDEVRRLRRNPA